MTRLTIITVILLIACAADAADRIVLRDLTIVSDKTVAAMTLDGVQLNDGTTIGWDAIETGRLDGGRQALFDKYLKNVGVHLFRIRQRLENGDYRSLSPSADAIAKYYRGRDGATAYMVMQAEMWGHLANGRRAAAVAPYLYCYNYLRRPQADATLPGKRRLQFDAASGMCDELPPIWFDADAAKKALPDVAAAIAKMQEPTPEATRIYYASLAIAAGDSEAADRALAGVTDNNPRLTQLKLIFAAQQEITAGSPGEKTKQLAAAESELVAANRSFARYWLGMAKVGASDATVQQEGVLDLLHLPAVHGADAPELAAAGLFQAINTLEELGDLRGSIAVRSELLSKYGNTYHAAQLADSDK